ncbi:MAG: hypothetical protein LBG27_01940 [Spirochaetaceae bacterium]|jgi:hypothetical protein|nr:hypothetical protein [Spirochaetaceae bacterium]
MRKIVAGFGVLLISCVSVPEGVSGGNEIPVSARNTDAVKEAAVDNIVFDPKNPPIEIYTATKLDIQDFIRGLDGLIKAKNYDGWLHLLSPGYFELINTEEFLDMISQQPRLKSRNIVLQNSRDYFLNVVVTSRADLQAHDIEFLTMTRVMAFTIDQKEQRIRIYTLDKTPESWEIVD